MDFQAHKGAALVIVRELLQVWVALRVPAR
jgi:hypothetical protein